MPGIVHDGIELMLPLLDSGRLGVSELGEAWKGIGNL